MTLSEAESILVDDPAEFNGRLRVLTINRPHKRNALNEHALKSLISHIRAADQDPQLRVLVITGAGDRAFCAGADLTSIVKEEGSIEGISAFGELFLVLQNIGIPVVAAVNGVAVGGGLGIVLASDLVVMSDKAQLGAPEVRRGLFAMFILPLVYQAFPEKIANKMLMLGEMIDAQQVLKLNIANQLTSPERVLVDAFKLAKPLCGMSGAVLRAGKRAIRRQKDLGFSEAISFLGEELKANLALKDSQEGIAAFLEKRPPVWTDS